MDQNWFRHRNNVWAITKVIFNYTDSPGEKIPQKVVGGYFFDSHCTYKTVMEIRERLMYNVVNKNGFIMPLK